MVVVAQPDDEILGLGATMYRLIKDFECVTHVVILGEGITSRSDTRDIVKWEKQLFIHKNNIELARQKIGYNTFATYNFPDNRFDSVS